MAADLFNVERVSKIVNPSFSTGFLRVNNFSPVIVEILFDAGPCLWSNPPLNRSRVMKNKLQSLLNISLVTVGAAALLASEAHAEDRYWSGDGGSDNISDPSNWHNGTPGAGDNLYFNNTGGGGANRHFVWFDYADYFTFGKIIFYSGSGGFTNKLYGQSLKFTSVLENNVSDSLLVHNENVSVANDGTGHFYINAFGGEIYFKLDGVSTGGTGSSSLGSFFLAGQTMNLGGTKNITFESVIADGGEGVGNIVMNGNQTVTFSGTAANTYTGSTTINTGTLNLSKATAGTNAIVGNILLQGGTLQYGTAQNNQIADSAKLTISSGTYALAARSETIGQTATATSGLQMSGGNISLSSGTLTVANSAVITAGSIGISSSGNFTVNTELNFSGGTINSSYTGATASGLNLRGGAGTGITYAASGTSTAEITNSGGGAFRVSLNTTGSTVFNIADSASVATEMIISAPIVGGTASGIEKTGTGKMVFSGANTYSGPTVVNGGTLLANNTIGSATSAGAVTVNNTGTLGGTGTITPGANNVTINSGGRITAADIGSIGQLTMTANALNLTNNSAYVADLNSTTSDRLVLSGLLNISSGAALNLVSSQPLTAASYTLAEYGSWNGTSFSTVTLDGGSLSGYNLNYGTNALTLTAVPEPGTWAAGILALLAVAFTQRRRFRRAVVRA